MHGVDVYVVDVGCIYAVTMVLIVIHGVCSNMV